MTAVDISRTLHDLGALYKDDDDEYAIRYDPKVYQAELDRISAKGYKEIDESCLHWKPSVFKKHMSLLKQHSGLPPEIEGLTSPFENDV